MTTSLAKKALSLALASAVAAVFVTGCSANQPSASQVSSTDDYVQVCQDKDTNQRVDDDKCDNGGTTNRYQPAYYHYNSMIPSIGTALLMGYILSPPARSMVYRGAVPTSGGYAPQTRPNSGFLKVPDDFVGGPPPVPKAPVSVPTKAAAVPPQVNTPPKTVTPPKAPAQAPKVQTNKAPTYKAPSFKK